MSKSSGTFSSFTTNDRVFRPQQLQSPWNKIPPMYNENLAQTPVLVQDADMNAMALKATSSGSSNSRRTRITRACDTCRRKKIKCDVDSDQSCSTCKQSGWECTFNDTAKKRGPPKGYIESLENRLKKMEKLLEHMDRGGEEHEDHDVAPSGKKARMSSDGVAVPTPNHTLSPPTSENSDGRSPHSEPRTDTAIEPTGSEGKPKVVSYHGSSSGYYLLGNILSNEKEQDSARSRSEDNRVNAFLSGVKCDKRPNQQPQGVAEPDQTSISTSKGTYRLRRMNIYDDDLMLVRDVTEDEKSNQIAVDQQETIDNVVIDRPLLEGLVKYYFKAPHTILPILDENDYMDAFEGHTTPPPPPLLTLAICTCACFLMQSDDPLFKQADMERDKLCALLIEKANSLFRREYLTPRVSTIQALILLCTYPPCLINSFRNWVMTGLAVRMAQELGLHRTLTGVELPAKKLERRKLLWYGVYIIDRWCCAVMGHPLAISDSDCDVELPDTKTLAGANCTTFINFAKLSGILGEVLRHIYSPKAKSKGYKTPAMEQTVKNLLKLLSEWYEQLPSDRRITSDDIHTANQYPDRLANSKKLTEGGPLTICYHAVTLLLLRPFIVLENEGDRSEFFKDTKRRCVQAAKAAIDAACVVPVDAIIQFGWNFAAYSVFQASLIHVYNCTSPDPETARTAREYISRSMSKCLSPLTDNTPSCPPALRFLQSLLSLIRADPSIVRIPPTQAETQRDSGAMEPSSEHGCATTTTDVRHSPPSSEYYTTGASSMTESQASPMSVQQIVSGFDNTMNTDKTAMGKDASPWSFGSESNGVAPSTLTQATWQQLFSSAGAPFSSDSTNLFDLQGWDNLFFDQNGNVCNSF